MPTFNYYSGVSDPIQNIKHFRDKMVLYSRNDLIICLTFPFNLEGVTSDWFYSLPLHSLHNFEEVTKAFSHSVRLSQGGQEEQPSPLPLKMRQGDSLKSYICYFQSQLAKVPNSREDVSALAFISGLQISYPLYKHLWSMMSPE